MDLLADVSIAEAQNKTKSTGLRLQAGKAGDTKKQEEHIKPKAKPKPRPKWSGKCFMITYIAGRCATCRQHGILNATCSTCPSTVSETLKYLPMSPPKRGRHQSKATKSLKVLESRKRTAKKSFRQWLETSFDVQSAHEHERLRITDLFQRYKRYCHQNKHETLMSMRSKIKELKFTANILEYIRRKLGRKRPVLLMKDRTDFLCFPYMQFKKLSK